MKDVKYVLLNNSNASSVGDGGGEENGPVFVNM